MTPGSEGSSSTTTQTQTTVNQESPHSLPPPMLGLGSGDAEITSSGKLTSPIKPESLSGGKRQNNEFAKKTTGQGESGSSSAKRKSPTSSASRPSSTAGSSSSRKRKAALKTPNREPVAEKQIDNNESDTDTEETDDTEVTFEDYSILCERVAKTMYYANPKPPTTPRPSLPLTILAVDTFAKYARKDTLEFLDIDMAAEIGEHACVSPTALVFALVYLERLSVNNPGYLKTIKPSELFVVSLLVASKFVQDDGEDLGIFNDEWATSANMELKKLNQLELQFLTAIDWQVNIAADEYERSLRNIEEKMALYQGTKRGWFTYTELKSLTNTYLTMNVVLPVLRQRIFEVVSAICVMYTTFFATLMTSSVLAPYILSLSKAVLTSTGTGTSSLLIESSLSSCLQDISLQNSTLPLSQDVLGDATTPTTNIQRFVHSGQWLPLPSEEDQENSTQKTDIIFSERLKQQINNALHQHRRSYETANGNYGYSFKCESNCRRHYSDDESIANVQRVLEKLLRSSDLINTKPESNFGNQCLVKNCRQHQPPLLQVRPKALQV